MAVNLLLTARFFRQLWYLPLTALTLKFYPLSFLILPLQWPYYPMFFLYFTNKHYYRNLQFITVKSNYRLLKFMLH